MSAGWAASTPCGSIVECALAGNRVAVERFLEFMRTVVGRYCRARIGRHDGTFEMADRVAREVCHAVLAALAGWPGRDSPVLVLVYRTARRTVDLAAVTPDDGQPAAVVHRLPLRQREVLVLLSVVGLSYQDTAAVLGCQVSAVSAARRRALRRLVATSAGGRFARRDTASRLADTSSTRRSGAGPR